MATVCMCSELMATILCFTKSDMKIMTRLFSLNY